MFISHKWRYYVLRLKEASLRELFYRLKELVFIWRLKYAHLKLIAPKNHICPTDLKNIALPDLEHEIDSGKSPASPMNLINYHCIEPCGEAARDIALKDVFFSDIRIENLDYDIRKLWEPARLQHITALLTVPGRNPKHRLANWIKRYCKNIVLLWIYENPLPFGPHYISVMECALRIPVFVYCLKILDNLAPSEFRKILETIYSYSRLISERLSLFSSLGNHTIAESVGLIFSGGLFRHLKEGKEWLQKGSALLKKEVTHQILDDGGPAEQSLNYHRFVLDLYWLAIIFMKLNRLDDCPEIQIRLACAEKFLSVFQNENGQLPSIGDSDDGFAIAPGIAPQKPRIDYPKKKIRIFKKSGYTVITTAKRVRLAFDHGPLGLPPLYNHGHADALSITLNLNGEAILVDPGTYQYNGVPEWRRYFRGTRAHNTITVDGLDQSVQETEFIWSHPYRVKVLGFSGHNGQFLINAEHDGYARLEEPVWHRRDVLFFDDCLFLIKDSFKGKGLHDFEINFHLHPDTFLIKQKNWWQISNDGARINMRLLDDDFSIICGAENPIHGWYSPSYGTRLRSNVMSCKKKGFADEIFFVTAICTETLNDIQKIQDKLIYFD